MIRLAVRVRREQAELVLAELLELAPAGVEEVQGADTVEYAVYGAPGELPSLPALNAAVGDALVEISTTRTADDWQERWREFHRPVLIAPPAQEPGEGARLPKLLVRPPWEPSGAGTGVQEIVIDPGQAFGTGGHASTRLCLEVMLELAGQQRPGGPLLDVGTGSGVLAIAATRLGFAPVFAVDNERESVAAARENTTANGAPVMVSRADLRTGPLPWIEGARGAGPVVVANLLRPLLLELAGTLPGAPSHVLAGGLLAEEVEEIAGVFGDRWGLRARARRERDGWAVLWLSAP